MSARRNEADSAKLAAEPGVDSSSFSAPAGVDAILCPDDTCWRIARTDRFGLIVDAATYFAAVRAAMLKARHSIMLVGWDFDLRIDLVRNGKRDGHPVQLGAFLKGIVKRNPGLRIFILKWDMAVLYTLTNQLLPMIALDLITARRIRLRFDSTHPWTAAHHQKIVVIADLLAFCGGIDMTVGRWDTCRHLPGDERRKRPDGSLFGPWHDATAIVDGDAARALGVLARDRWHRATGEALERPRGEGDLWPDAVEPQMRDVDLGIARTMPAYDGRQAVHEVENLYRAAIRSAKKSIYLESQYFASASICEAIAKRLKEADGPEVVVINPLSTEGWLEQETMGTARDLRLASIRQADPHGRFGIFHPANETGEPIYVHAKILIVDDRLIRVGSSNVNNRSMGFDTECDLAIEAKSQAEREAISSIRNGLLAEHLGVKRDRVEKAIAERGSLLGTVEALRQGAGRSLRPIPERQTNAAERFLSRSHLADPERPEHPEKRLEHLAKRFLLRLSSRAWLGLAAAGLGLFILSNRRRHKRQAGGRERLRASQKSPAFVGRRL